MRRGACHHLARQLLCAAAERRFAHPAPVRACYDRAAGPLGGVDPRGAELLEGAREDALAYLALPRAHARWLRTNNVMERLNHEIKRRTDSVQVFPSADLLVRLVGAVSVRDHLVTTSSGK